MKFAFIVVFISLVILGFTLLPEPHPNQAISKRIEVGEDITYVVKYLAFEIGEIRLKVLKEIVDDVDTLYSAIAYIDSYDGIPFVDLHQIYETKFDKKLFSHYFKGTILSDDTTYTKYDFNGKKKIIHIQKGRERTNQVWKILLQNMIVNIRMDFHFFILPG